MRAILFANGEINDPGYVLDLLRPADLIIAVDGGTRHCLSLGLYPAIVIGDFDSLESKDLESLRKRGTQLIQYPLDKDYTDLELALHYAIAQGTDDVIIFGALGARWDQTLANMLLLGAVEFQKIRVTLLDEKQEISLIIAGESRVLSGQAGETISLIPISGDVRGVSTSELKYPLKNETLYFGATRGISNLFLKNQATIEIAQGMLLCVIIHQQLEGLP